MRFKAKATLALVTVGMLLGVLVVATPGARAGHEGYTLDVEEELGHAPLGSVHYMTAKVPMVTGAPVEVHFEFIRGPNAFQPCCDKIENEVQVKDDPAQPDDSCLIRAGETSCMGEIRDTRAVDGQQDVILAWIDHDVSASPDPSTGIDFNEFQDAGEPPHGPGVDTGSPGDQGEPDTTDLVVVNWGQMKVGQIPFNDGNIEFFQHVCDSTRSRVGGEVVGVARVCTYVASMDPSQESDSASDHYGFWVQATGDAKGRGWCATKFAVTARAPAGSMRTSFASLPEATPARRQSLTATLIVDANGTASSPGYVEASAFAYPGSITITEDGNDVTTTWRGKTKKLLAVPVGVAFSAPAGSGLPDPGDPNDVVLKLERRRCG